MPNKVQNGKGENWDTRKNPFLSAKTGHIAPELADVASFGRVVDLVLRNGCALMVGHTRDGGALVLTVLDGEYRHRTYCSNASELEDAITSMQSSYEID